MTRLLVIALTVLALATGTAEAGPKGQRGHKAKPAEHGQSFCPPGLAKKNPPCVPPGLAKKIYKKGDIAGDNCKKIAATRFRSLEPGSYCVIDNMLHRIDPETRKIFEILRILDE